jgi:hypothetical protein
MHGHHTRLLNPCLARSQRICVSISFDNKIGTVFTDARDLGLGRDRRNKDLGWNLQSHCRIRDRRSVVATRRGGNARRRDFTKEKICERAASLKGTGVLK